MSKQALISRHIVLTSHSQNRSPNPRYAIILIEDERIHDIQFLDDSVPVNLILEKYHEWNPLDFSDFYISPGLVDVHVRREFEDYSTLTAAAVAGGVTFILEEEPFYSDSPPSGELFCDVGTVCVIDASSIGSLASTANSGCFAFKGYLYPPCSTVGSLPGNLEGVFLEARGLNMPVIIDPNMPVPSRLYAASPFRLENIEKRMNGEDTVRPSLFAAAYSNEVCLSDMSEDEESSTEILRCRTRSEIEEFHHISGALHSTVLCSVSTELLGEEEGGALHCIQENDTSKKKKRRWDIYDDLNARIKQNNATIENLSKAEQDMYLSTGNITYKRSRSVVIQASELKGIYNAPLLATSPLTTPTLYERKKQLRLAPLQITAGNTMKESVYSHHLANYPDYWEIRGVEAVLGSLVNEHCKVHICGVSSAAALNRVRQAKETNKLLSSELSAVHLYFNSSEVKDKDTRFKNNSVVRGRANCNLLWELLTFKGVDALTSGHASIDPLYKAVDTGNFQVALNGINSLGFTLQAVWSRLNVPVAKKEHLEHYLVRISEWTSLNPATVVNCEGSRGSLEKGKFADLVIWEPYERTAITHTHAGNPSMCIYIGHLLHGKIHRVLVRGQVAYNNGQLHPIGKKVIKT